MQNGMLPYHTTGSTVPLIFTYKKMMNRTITTVPYGIILWIFCFYFVQKGSVILRGSVEKRAVHFIS